MTDKDKKPHDKPSKEGKRPQQRKNWQRTKPVFHKKKDPEEIPVLKYGPGNNFSKFKEAISNAALKEYGALGKLIKQGRYDKIEPKEPDETTYNLATDPYGVNKERYLEDCKEYRKELSKMRENRPKLYGLITQYLSDESKDEVKRQEKYEEIEKAADPEGLWKLVEETHKINSISKVVAVTKLATRSTYYSMRQGAYESIITYKERFDNAKKAYEDQENPTLDDKDVAMDFFKGLDDARYGGFKTDFMNQLTLKTISQPENLNEMYLIANQWLKVNTKTTSSGYGTTFVTTLDYQEKSKRGKKEKGKREETKKEKEDKDDKREKKDNKDISEVECYACGEKGHYANKCPSRQPKENDDKEKHSHFTTASTFVTYHVHNVAKQGQFKPTEILLDNQANISIMNPMLLRNIQDAEQAVQINGVGGHQFAVDKTGYLDPLFRVYASEETHANILSLSQVEDHYLVTYVPQENFIIHLPTHDIIFHRQNGMYVADWADYYNVFSTTTTKTYTKAEESRAKQAYELLRASGFPSAAEASYLLQDGNITGMPALTLNDLRRAYELYGTPPEYVRGKMTKRKVSRAVIDKDIMMTEKQQVLYSDVMHIDGQKFLITTCEPLQLTLQCSLTSESQTQLGLGLQGHLSILRSKGFEPTIVYTDPAKGFAGLIGAFPGVLVDTSGAGDNVSKVDAKIRRLKELYRSVKNGLAWPLPTVMVRDLVAYAVSRLNIRRTTAINHNVCPRVLFTGVKVNFKKELEIAFGDYCEVYDGTDNTSASRSVPCIALYPTGNSTGAWEFMNLLTKQRVRRSQWKAMKTTDLIIDTMKFFEEKQQKPVPVELQQPSLQETTVSVEATGTQETQEQEITTEQEEVAVPDLVEDPGESDDEDEEEIVAEPEEEPAGIASRTRSQTKKYAMAVKINKTKETDPSRKKAIEAADKAEIELLFVDLQGLKPVKEQEVTGQKVYNSHMFSVEKFLADGTHDKFKSRLVFDGRDQDPELFPDRSSPTAALHSLMACVAVASANGLTKVGKIDVKGAFIQTEMTGPPLYIRCTKELTRLIVEVLPAIGKYVNAEGILYCRLLKALYGCVQASKLWFDKLTKFLRTQGYEHAPTDPCVMRKVVGDKIFLLVIYVDDILILAEEEEIERLHAAFVQEYQWITMEIDSVHSYLGMQIEFHKQHATINMTHFVEKLLQTSGEEDLREFACPAMKDIFTVDSKAKALTEGERKQYHTNVAKLLYLSKRARPDILTAVGFLCTRVTRATIQDRVKLRRVLGYLKRTKEKVLNLKIGDLHKLTTFIDAAFASHPDAKSQTGIAVFLGKALVFAASRKQKCVSKSPTDSELIALSDNIYFVELFNEFLSFILNKKLEQPLIYEDCKAMITLVTEGGGVMRTKHLRVRMELCKEALQDQKFTLQYISTKAMIADGLTKALEGVEFTTFAETLLGTAA